MPKIKAYSWNKQIIPINHAKTITCYECPWTKKIFKTKKSYLAHLVSVREDNRRRWFMKNFQKRMNNELWNKTSFPDVIRYIEDNPEILLNGKKDNFWIKFTYLDITFSPTVSNSHNAPHNGVTNWIRSNDKPTSYPGWRGRIEFQVSSRISSFGGDLLKKLRIHTGTGGGINENRYGYDVIFFDADWPCLSSEVSMKILANDRSQTRFAFGTPIYFR